MDYLRLLDRLDNERIGRTCDRAEADYLLTLALSTGLAECERLRAANEHVWNRAALHVGNALLERDTERERANEWLVQKHDAESLCSALMTAGLAECERLRAEREEWAEREVDRQVAEFCDEHNRQCAYDCAHAEKLEEERDAARTEVERLRAAVIAFATGLVVDNDAAWRALEKLLRTVAADGPGPGATT